MLDEARRVGVGATPPLILAGIFVDVFDRRYEAAIARLSAGAPELIQDQFRFLPRTLLLAELHGLAQRPELAAVYYDSARAIVARKLQDDSTDSRLHSTLGIAYAGLGRREEAVAEGLRAVELLPVERDAYRGYYRLWDLARISAMVGDEDTAIETLERLLSLPGNLTRAWLRADPTWDVLRDHPRFQRLVQVR